MALRSALTTARRQGRWSTVVPRTTLQLQHLRISRSTRPTEAKLRHPQSCLYRTASNSLWPQRSQPSRMSHLTPPSPDAALSSGTPPSPPHLLRRKRSSANAALISRPSLLALKTAAISDASAAAQSTSDGAVTLGLEGALAGMSMQGATSSTEDFPSLQRLIFAHFLVPVTSAEDAAAAPRESAATCQVQLHWALFRPDLLVTSSGAIYKLNRDEWTAMRDPVERLRGLVKSGQSILLRSPPPPLPPPSPTGEQDFSQSQSQSEVPVLAKTPLGLPLPRREYRTSTAAVAQETQASWLVLPPADADALDNIDGDGAASRKVADLITLVARYPAQEGAKIEDETADALSPAPSQIEDVLKLDLQALAGQAHGSTDDVEGKKETLRRVLDLFRA